MLIFFITAIFFLLSALPQKKIVLLLNSYENREAKSAIMSFPRWGKGNTVNGTFLYKILSVFLEN